MNFNELKEALKEREFGVLKSVKIKKRNKEMLDILSKEGIDIGAVIDLGLEKIKLDRIVKNIEKNRRKNEAENTENVIENNTESSEEISDETNKNLSENYTN
jgi:ribosomal 50S subunit-recycling heat shock protein